MSGGDHSGAYGFRLVYVDPEITLPDLLELDGRADKVLLSASYAPAERDVYDVAEGRVRLAARGRGSLDVTREPRSIVLKLQEPPSPEALVHPLVTAPLAILSRWRGDSTLHGGAIYVDGTAFSVCGGRTAGKSSLLATLAGRSIPIMADDLVVVADGVVHAGPSCVDLRPDTAERFGARPLGLVGGRPRFRLTTPPSPSAAPLGGFFELAWSDESAPVVEELTPSEKLRLLHAQEYAGIVGPPQPEATFDLLELPMWRLHRPRDWARTDAAAALLLATAKQAVQTH
jgi:hypothetical protein